MKKFLQSFFKKQDGAVAIIVAVALVAILFGVLSLSIDLNRTQTSYTHNYNGTDAAALAAAEMWLQAKIDAIGKIDDPLDFRPTDAEMTDYAKKVLESNFAQDQSSSTLLDKNNFTVTMDDARQADGKTLFTVKVDACAQLDLTVANVSGHVQDDKNPGKATTCTTSTAGFELGKLENAEVAFALDFTESMYWKGANQGCPPGNANPDCPTFEQTKAARLQDAMEYVFDKYFDSTKKGTAFASIVPYTSFVNAYPYHDNGLVVQGVDKIKFDGKAFLNPPPGSTQAESDAFYARSDNAWSQYYPISLQKTIGPDLKTFVFDPDYTRSDYTSHQFRPFYTFAPYEGDPNYETENYSYILNRVPTISSDDKLKDIINNPDNLSFLPLDNYHNLVDYIANENFVWDKTLSDATDSPDPNEQYAKMGCYQFTVAAAADERAIRPDGTTEGVLKSSLYSKFYTGKNGNKDHGLFESFPVQPLTNDVNVLNNVLERYVADTRLTSAYNGRTDVIDFQSSRIDKATLMSSYHKTSSIHGLMWAWFTINNAWQDKWDEISLHENYVGGNKSARDGSGGKEVLPSAKNFKHIILISDGFDNDGCNDRSGGTTSDITGSLLGRQNVCDAYAPVAAVTDDQYTDLCTAIKTNGTPDNEGDDTSIHMVTLDFDPKTGEVNDGVCDKKGGANNRFARCASAGEYYENVQPSALEKRFDNIFAGILTKAVPVRLIK